MSDNDLLHILLCVSAPLLQRAGAGQHRAALHPQEPPPPADRGGAAEQHPGGGAGHQHHPGAGGRQKYCLVYVLVCCFSFLIFTKCELPHFPFETDKN